MPIADLKKALQKDKTLLDRLSQDPEKVLKEFHISGSEYTDWMSAAKTGKLKERINTIQLLKK